MDTIIETPTTGDTVESTFNPDHVSPSAKPLKVKAKKSTSPLEVEEQLYNNKVAENIRKYVSDNEWVRSRLDEYANLVLGLVGNNDAQPFKDYVGSRAIGGALSLGEVMFYIIRRCLQDRDFSGALDSGWDAGLSLSKREISCEMCHFPIPNARLGQRFGCNAAGVIMGEKKQTARPPEELCENYKKYLAEEKEKESNTHVNTNE